MSDIPLENQRIGFSVSVGGESGKCPICGVSVAANTVHRCKVVTITFDELPGIEINVSFPMTTERIVALRDALTVYIEQMEAGNARP